MPRPRADGMQPSTSMDTLKHSPPHSPMERLAKRNALLMNEMDSRGKRSYFSNVMGTIPEFPIVDLATKCGAVPQILDYESSALTSEALGPLQKQLEDLIAENADYQKRLNGEIAFLNTGDYPTDDLSDRLLPVYMLREKDPNEPSVVPIDNLADMGLHSSPEDDVKNPIITDVPRRFWNWTREYLGHITEEDIINFKSKVVDRFRGDILQSYLQEAVPPKLSCKNGAKKSTKRRASHDCPIPTKLRPIDISPTKCESLLSQAFTFVLEPNNELELKKAKESQNEDEGEEVASKSRDSNGFTTPTRRSSLRQDTAHELNDHECGGHRNGSSPTTLLNGFKRAMESAVALSNGSAFHTSSFKNGTYIDNGNEIVNHLLLNADDTEDNLDEVSKEIKKKQRELAQLSQVTRPVIDTIFERMEGEYALYEVSRRLDLSEDKLFQLGKKYDGIKTFTKEQRKECVKALNERYVILQQMYRRHFQEEIASEAGPKTSPTSRKVSFSTKNSIINNACLSNSVSETSECS